MKNHFCQKVPLMLHLLGFKINYIYMKLSNLICSSFLRIWLHIHILRHEIGLFKFWESIVFCIKSLDWFFSRIWKQIFLAFFGPFYYAIHIHQFHVVNFKGPTCYPFIEKYKGKESKCSFDSKSLTWYILIVKGRKVICI